ncbi:MAG: response regulator [Elusimicrobiota bacterium]
MSSRFEFNQFHNNALKTVPAAKLMGRIKMSEFMEMHERDFYRHIRNIENIPLFRKLFCPAKLIPGKGRILVMDDEEMVRKVTGRLLERLGYTAEFVKDGDEAVNAYKKAKESGKPFDAVIMDLPIPGGMGGKEAVLKILEIDPDAKAIVSNGYSTDPIMSDFKKYGFSNVLTKPFSLEEVSVVLNDVLKGEGDGSI